MQYPQFYRPLKDVNIAQPQPATALAQGQEFLQNKEAFQLNKMKAQLAMTEKYLPALKFEDYGKYKKHLENIGAKVFADLLPDEKDLTREEFQETKNKIIMGTAGIRQASLQQMQHMMRQAEEAVKQKNREKQADYKFKKSVELEKIKQGRPPSTLAAAWLKQNPNPSEEDIIKFNNSMKGKGLKATIGPDGTVIMEMGGAQDLGVATTNKLQKEVVDLSGQLQQISNLEDSAFTDVLTLQGKIFQKGLRLADYLKVDIGEENKEYLGKARVFIENIEKVFNSYRKEITGAQAAMKEIEMLRTSILNKKLTPTEFEHSIKSFKNAVLRGLRLKRMLLAQGVSGKNLPQQLDTLYSSENDVPDSEMDRRGDELLAGGLSETEVIEKLREEGYNL